jgi:hypothetical protein
LVGPLAARIAKTAPTLEFRPSGALHVPDLLDRGDLDLAIGPFPDQGERFSRRRAPGSRHDERRAAQKLKNRRRRLLRGFLGQVMANDGDQPALIRAGEEMRLRVCLRGDGDAAALTPAAPPRAP